jgi:hypothetical protein
MRTHREQVAAGIQELEARQDQLLEKLAHG